MEGMNIITQTPDITNCTIMGVMFTVLGIIMIVGPMVIFFIANAKRTRDEGHFYAILGFLIGMAMIFTSPRFFNTETGQYTYECTFDGDHPDVEFDESSTSFWDITDNNFNVTGYKSGVDCCEDISFDVTK